MWLSGGGCGWKLLVCLVGVFLILLIYPYCSCICLFLQQHPYFFFHFVKMIFRSYIIKYIRAYARDGLRLLQIRPSNFGK